MGRSSKKPEKSRKNGTKRILVRSQSGTPRTAVQQEIGKRNIKYGFQSPELMRFGDFVWFLYKMLVDIYQKMSIILSEKL